MLVYFLSSQHLRHNLTKYKKYTEVFIYIFILKTGIKILFSKQILVYLLWQYLKKREEWYL